MVVGVHVPALRRHLADPIHPIAQQPPVRLRIVRPTRKPAAQPDDGNRLGAPSLDCLQLRAHLLQLDKRPLQQRLIIGAFHAPAHPGFLCWIVASSWASKAASATSESASSWATSTPPALAR